MTPETMLDTLNSHGNDAGADFNDSEAVDGWFGWSINKTGILTITHTPASEAIGGADEANTSSHSWRLVPIEAQPSTTDSPSTGRPEGLARFGEVAL